MTTEEILKEYPDLEPEDIRQLSNTQPHSREKKFSLSLRRGYEIPSDVGVSISTLKALREGAYQVLLSSVFTIKPVECYQKAF